MSDSSTDFWDDLELLRARVNDFSGGLRVERPECDDRDRIVSSVVVRVGKVDVLRLDRLEGIALGTIDRAIEADPVAREVFDTVAGHATVSFVVSYGQNPIA